MFIISIDGRAIRFKEQLEVSMVQMNIPKNHTGIQEICHMLAAPRELGLPLKLIMKLHAQGSIGYGQIKHCICRTDDRHEPRLQKSASKPERTTKSICHI